MEAQHDDQYAYEVARLFPPQGRWREADYFSLPDSNEIIELTEGEIIVSPPPTSRHQRIVMELAYALRRYTEDHGTGTVLVAPLAVRLKDGLIRQPDVLLYRAEHADRIGEQVSQPPDWCAEVISPGSRETDTVDKLAEYAEAGIAEYWLVDPEEGTVRVYTLPPSVDVYEVVGTYSGEDVVKSPLLAGFGVSVTEVIA